MAREISLVCDFIFGSIHTGLLTGTVDIELMIRMVNGICMYRKDHMAESMVFSPWSRTVIPFPSLHRKIQAFHDESRQAMVYFSAPPKPKHKCAIGKTRTRWSNRRHCFNPIKTERCNMQDSNLTDLNKIDIIQPTPNDSALELSKGVFTVSMMLHIPPQPHQTGLVKTGMAKRPKQKSKGHLLTLSY